MVERDLLFRMLVLTYTHRSALLAKTLVLRLWQYMEKMADVQPKPQKLVNKLSLNLPGLTRGIETSTRRLSSPTYLT